MNIRRPCFNWLAIPCLIVLLIASPALIDLGSRTIALASFWALAGGLCWLFISGVVVVLAVRLLALAADGSGKAVDWALSRMEEAAFARAAGKERPKPPQTEIVPAPAPRGRGDEPSADLPLRRR